MKALVCLEKTSLVPTPHILVVRRMLVLASDQSHEWHVLWLMAWPAWRGPDKQDHDHGDISTRVAGIDLESSRHFSNADFILFNMTLNTM